MIKLKNLLSEISLMSGDASENDMKNIFDQAFRDGVLPKKYRKLYYSTDYEAKGDVGDMYTPEKESKKAAEKILNLNKVTPETIKFLDKYETVGSSGNYIMILKKKGGNMDFMLCDKSAKYLTEFFIGVIKAEKGANTYKFDSKKAFNLETYQIHWSNIAAEHKGKGLGRMMYTMVYEYISGPLGAALVSDSTLFQGSQKMWMQYMPTIAKFFGIVVSDVFFPIDRSEIGGSVMENNVDMMVAMETVPTEIRKIAHNVKGLSFKKGEYGTIRIGEDINKKIALDPSDTETDFNYDRKRGAWVPKKNKNFQYTHFSNLVDEATSIAVLINRMEKLDMDVRELVSNTESTYSLKVCVFEFNNMNVIIKKTGGKLVMVAI